MYNAGKREMGPKCGSLPRNAGELAGLLSFRSGVKNGTHGSTSVTVTLSRP